MLTNWFGMISHPTDDYVHCSVVDDARVESANDLRKSWDMIVELGPEYERALRFLIREARSEAIATESYNNQDFSYE